MSKDQNSVEKREQRNSLLGDALKRRLEKAQSAEGHLAGELREAQARCGHLQEELTSAKEEITRLSEVESAYQDLRDEANGLRSTVQIQEALLGKDNELMDLIAQLLGPEIQEIMEERNNNANKPGEEDK